MKQQFLCVVLCLHGLCGDSALLGRGRAVALKSAVQEPTKDLQDPYAPEPGGAATVSEWCNQPDVHDPACEASPAAVSLDDEIQAVMRHLLCQRNPEDCVAKSAEKKEVVAKKEKADQDQSGKDSKADTGKKHTQGSKGSEAAKEEIGDSDKAFKTSDKDKDGKLSRYEFQSECDTLGKPQSACDKEFKDLSGGSEAITETQYKDAMGVTDAEAARRKSSKAPAPTEVPEVPEIHEPDAKEAAIELAKQVENLDKIKVDLTEKHQLDPELDRTLTKMIDTGTKAIQTLHNVAEMSTEDANKELDELKAEADKVDEAVFQFQTEVHPHGYKWWRYRWEYAFVEANTLNLLVFATMLLYLLINWATTKMKKFGTVLDKTGISVVNLYHKIFDRCLHEVMILGAIAFVIWAMEEGGLFTFMITHHPVKHVVDAHAEQEFHWPTTSQHVIYTLRTVNMHLFLGMLLYYLLMYHISLGAVCILELFMRYENPSFFDRFMTDGTASTDFQGEHVTQEMKAKADVARECFANKGPLGKLLSSDRTISIIFGHLNNSQDYKNLRNYFAAHVEHHEGFETLHKLIGPSPIYPYLAQKLYNTIEGMIQIDWRVWLMVQLVLVVQAVVHYHLHLAVVELLPLNFIIGAFILTIQYMWTRHRLAYVVDEKNQAGAKGEGKTAAELKSREVMERWLFWFQELNLFFVCFSAARLLCSSFFWTDYFKLSCILLATFLVMYALFITIGSLAVPMFIIMLSLPPNVTQEDGDLLRVLLEQQQDHNDLTPRSKMDSGRKSTVSCAAGLVVV